MAGLVLDDWQAWFLSESLSEQPDHQWSAFEVGLIVSRQCGKGSVLEARQLGGLTILRERLQVHTAHEFRTCFEHFLRMVQLVESCPEIDRQVARIRRGAGEQSIEMKSGQRLRFLARSGGSGRGMSGDAVYLDEAFALTKPMMGALLPTLSARPNPQIWYTSSAPMSSSVVLHDVRERGIKGESTRLFFAEWSAGERADPDDVDAWYQAVPALGIRISEEFIHAEREAMPDEEFLRERLGIPDPLPSTDGKPVKIPADKWAATVRTTRPDITPGKVTIGFDADRDGRSCSVVIAAGSIANPYVEQIEFRDGAGWLPDRLVELVRKWRPIAIGCNGAGPSTALVGPIVKAFADAGMSADLVTQLGTRDFLAACGGFYTDVIEGRLSRPDVDQGPLDRAAGDATERFVGEAWAWDRRQATVPISPLIAATVARGLLPPKPAAQVWAVYD